MESRDPLVRAAAAIRATEGLATKPCEACLRAGRRMNAPDVYVCRRIGGPNDGDCFVVYECPVCGHGSSYPIPPHLLLAADLRVDAAGKVDGDAPCFFYRDDGAATEFFLDPADGQDEIPLGLGASNSAKVGRARAAFDFFAGGAGQGKRASS